MVVEADILRIKPKRSRRSFPADVERCGFRQFRQREFGERHAVDRRDHAADRTDLLLDDEYPIRIAIGGGDCDRASDGRMAGERHLVERREDAHVRPVARIARRQDEGRLRQVEFVGDAQHACRIEPACIQNHRQRVASQGIGSEDIPDLVFASAHQFALIDLSKMTKN